MCVERTAKGIERLCRYGPYRRCLVLTLRNLQHGRCSSAVGDTQLVLRQSALIVPLFSLSSVDKA